MHYDKKDHHGNLLRWIVDLTNCQKYLEIGVEKSENIHFVRDYVKKCVGVDIVDQFEDKRGIFSEQKEVSELLYDSSKSL
jgi:hypothetical protein